MKWTTPHAATSKATASAPVSRIAPATPSAQEVHGNGANMDNFENHDERTVAPWTCFSIEPGVYLPEFGVRSEIDMFVGDREARVTGEIQRELALL